jgi:hypothetical protein
MLLAVQQVWCAVVTGTAYMYGNLLAQGLEHASAANLNTPVHPPLYSLTCQGT